MRSKSKKGKNNNYKISFFKNKLEESGYRLTKPRELILDILSNKSKFNSANNIYLMVRKRDPNIGIASVYRTLELLTRLNLICKISLGSDRSFYMLSKNCKKEAFNYMICSNCGRIITDNKCLNNAIKIRLVENAEVNIFKNCQIKIDSYQIFFTGLCNKCSTTTQKQ